jgi:hypothetical protein
MPYSPDNHAGNIAQLGKDVKRHRENSGEQFCVFAFDLDVLRRLEPPASSRTREDCLSLEEPCNWLAAFFELTEGQTHTERAVLEKFEQWYSDYTGTYGAPERLYIYSFLIPCLRDGHYGHCADAIAAQLLALGKRGVNLTVHIGWSNNDRDLDMAAAINTGILDLDDDRIDVSTCRVSIAG